jgi:uncharacterized protein (TIGR03083 family)
MMGLPHGTAATSLASLDRVEELAQVAERFAINVALTHPTARVPACPGWTSYELAVHLGNIHAWAATVVETGQAAPAQEDRPPSRRPRAVSHWYAGKAEDLYEVLRAARPDQPCWNFAGTAPVAGFWARRQLHEATVHLVDLDQAAGRATELSPLVCTDGVAEVLEVFLPRMHARGHIADLTAPLTLRTVDTDHVWTLTPRRDGSPFVAVRSEPGADLVEGCAGDLLLLLWKRAPQDHPGVSYVGNRERIAAFLDSRVTA